MSHHFQHAYCRELLKRVMSDVRVRYTQHQIQAAWAWRFERGNFEFHGPNGEYVYNLQTADCLWSARAEGWSQILEQASADERRGGA